MSKQKRLRRLLVAQEKVHGLAVAAAARARVRLEEAQEEQELLLRNASGENQRVSAELVQALSNIGQRSVRMSDLARTAQHESEAANQQGRLAKQLRRLVASQDESARRERESRELVEQLDGIAARLDTRAAQVFSVSFGQQQGDDR